MANEEFGKRLAAARKAKGWTQDRLSKELQCSQSAVSRWEQSNRAPEDLLDKALEYAEILGVNPIWLLLGVGAMEGSAAVTKNIKYFQMLESLPAKDRDAIFQMIERLHESTADPSDMRPR